MPNMDMAAAAAAARRNKTHSSMCVLPLDQCMKPCTCCMHVHQRVAGGLLLISDLHESTCGSSTCGIALAKA
jgi:hypothetical protein